MNKNEISIGCDIEENKRFKNKTLEKDSHFLKTIFTQNELDYCFKKSRPAQHLCARFCAKEAVIKSLCDSKNIELQFSDIEILNNDDGSPYINIKKYDNLEFKVSLSHAANYSIAFVIRIN